MSLAEIEEKVIRPFWNVHTKDRRKFILTLLIHQHLSGRLPNNYGCKKNNWNKRTTNFN